MLFPSDEIDAAVVRSDRQAKQVTAGSGYRFCCDLSSGRRRFDELTVAAIHRENVSVGRDRKPQKPVEVLVRRDVLTRIRGRRTKERVGNGRYPVVDRVRDIQRAVRRQAKSGGTDYQCHRIGCFRKARPNYGCRPHPRHPASLKRHVKHQARNSTRVHHVGRSCSHVAIEHVRDEQDRVATFVQRRHVPGPVDGRALEGLHRMAHAIKHDKASWFSRRGGSVGGGQAADDDPASSQNRQRSGQADTTGTGSGQFGRVDL